MELPIKPGLYTVIRAEREEEDDNIIVTVPVSIAQALGSEHVQRCLVAVVAAASDWTPPGVWEAIVPEEELDARPDPS